MCSERWKLVSAVLVLCLAAGCGDFGHSSTPAFPDGGLLADARPVAPDALASVAGVAAVSGFVVPFGDPMVVHATTRQVSLFGSEQAWYAILDAGCLEGGSRLVLEGVWRHGNQDDAGLARLEVLPAELAATLCAASAPVDVAGFPGARLEGGMGKGASFATPTSLELVAPLVPMDDFVVGAHHGVCDDTANCGIPSNSVEAVLASEAYGFQGIEVDARLTKDGVPIAYHDASFSAKVTKGTYCVGKVDDYPLSVIQANCQLHEGARIPTIEETLRAGYEDTQLRGLWLDAKVPDAIAPLNELARRYNERAAADRRRFKALVGLPDPETLDEYLKIDPSARAGCITEEALEDAENAGCAVWAVQLQRGFAPGRLAEARSKGIQSLYWTVNRRELIDESLADPNLGGLLTDRGPLVFSRYQLLHGGAR